MKSFSNLLIHQTSHVEHCSFTSSFSKLQKKVENLDYSSVMLQSVTWKGGIKAGEPEATWSGTSPSASQKHRHLSSEGHVATLENHTWKIIPNKVQNIDFRWNRLRGVNTNKTEDFKNLWNVHSQRVVFCALWGFRFSSRLSLPSQTSFWGCRAMEGYCEKALERLYQPARGETAQDTLTEKVP